MVKSMMAAKRVQYDKLVQDKQLLEWKRDSYREINSKLYQFKTNKLTDKYGVNGALNANKAVITGNTGALKAEANAEANGTEMKVSIERLATRATIETVGIGPGKSSKIMLAELIDPEIGKLPPNEQEALLSKELALSINGENFRDSKGKSLFTGKTSIAAMVSTINASARANVSASYDEITGKLIIRSKTSGAEGKVELGATTGDTVLGIFNDTPDQKPIIETNSAKGTGFTGSTTLAKLAGATEPFTSTDLNNEYKLSFKGINGDNPITFKGSDSIDSIISQLDTLGVTASFDLSKGKFSFKAEMGGNIELSKVSGDNTFFDIFNGVQTYSSGLNSQLTINGTKLEKDSNNFTINGVTLTLLETSAADKTTTINTQTDSSTAIETIKGFIEDYNSMIDLLNNKTNEVKYRDFAPLTEEQKKDMKEADIKAWTEKAQSGLLKNDDILKSTISSMRAHITGKISELSSIGITTGQYYENGKLYLNEAKLKTAIAENPQRIMDLLQGPSSDPGNGLFDNLVKTAENALERFSEKAGTDRYSASITGTYKTENVIGRTLKGYNNRLDTMQKNLVSAENRYYKQFSAMETAMSKLQSQSSNLMSSLGLSSK